MTLPESEGDVRSPKGAFVGRFLGRTGGRVLIARRLAKRDVAFKCTGSVARVTAKASRSPQTSLSFANFCSVLGRGGVPIGWLPTGRPFT